MPNRIDRFVFRSLGLGPAFLHPPLPKFLRREARAFGEIVKFGPDNGGMDLLFRCREGGEAAVAPGHNVRAFHKSVRGKLLL